MIGLRQHFLVEQPCHFKPGDEPRFELNADGKPHRLIKLSPDGTRVPMIGHFLWTRREPPPMHLTIDGVLVYAGFNVVEGDPVTVKHVDITS